MILLGVEQKARFDPRALTICVNNFTAQEVQAVLDRSDWAGAMRVLPIIAHEVTHWQDTIGTLWGKQYREKVFMTYLLQKYLKLSGSERTFFFMMELHDEERRMHYSKYYTVESGERQPAPPGGWSVEVSSGLEFNPQGKVDNNRPILFVRMSDGRGGGYSVRQPICVAALLEVSATWSEIKTSKAICQKMEADESALHNFLNRKELYERFQDPEFSLYSAPVHLLKKYCEIKELHDAYKLSASLVFVCLNLTGSHFQNMSAPHLPDFGAEWNKRFEAMSSKELISYAYFCLSTHAQKWSGDFQSWLGETLASANLPSMPEIILNTEKTLESEKTNSKQHIFDSARNYMSHIGAKVVSDRGAADGCGLDVFEMIGSGAPMLPFFDEEGKIVDIGGTEFDLKKFDPQVFFDIEAQMHTQVRNFVSGCR